MEKRNSDFCLVRSKLCAFTSLLTTLCLFICQHFFTLRIISPPVSLACTWQTFGGLFMFMEIFNIFFKTIFKKWPQAYTHSILDTRLKKGGSGSQKLKRQHRSKHPITTGLQTTNTVNKNKILGQMLIRSNASFSFWFFFSFIAATLELLSGIILCCALFLYLFAALFHSLEFNL